MGAVQHTPKTSLAVKPTDYDRQFWIEGTAPGEDFDERHVTFGGYFGSYNPSLFAAAPDLRDALSELRNECSGRPRPDHLLAILAKADAALAKAEGRTDA